MAGIRETASGAGLTVAGFVIQDPGPGPTRPADKAGVQMPVPEVRAYEAAVSAYNQHQELIRAYNQAATEVGEVHSRHEEAKHRLADEYAGMEWPDVAMTSVDFAAGAALARMGKYQAKTMRAQASFWSRESAAWMERMRKTDYRVYESMENVLGPDAAKRRFTADLEHQKYLDDKASKSAAAADEAKGKFGAVAKNVSRGLVGVGVVADLASGESIPQALVSNVGSYAAGAAATSAVSVGTSMLSATAAGALAGSAVPVVGTAVGAVVGLGVGIFASGAIDSLFENGGDVSQAVSDGAEAVTDTVGAVADGFEAAGDFVGDLF
jgi:hypothetical protein